MVDRMYLAESLTVCWRDTEETKGAMCILLLLLQQLLLLRKLSGGVISSKTGGGAKLEPIFTKQVKMTLNTEKWAFCYNESAIQYYKDT